ncbi:hypothetical protein B0T17DRAFT_485406 [Bombardia bombarda]|uniref:Uncharacterized protein n=1 Tax=Bombardia bombarda TaxID=252184 RepID=A0AA39XMT0_9PEZI|nr:hypothetical protein B0T17DRAFT_485406 [Bombardia bombarda]
MSLTAASQFTHRARYARSASLGALRPYAAVVVRHRDQHIRGFRFGRIWSSYLDPEIQSDISRRHRHIRHKYADSLNRRLSWEKHPLAEDPRSTLKRMVNDYWNPDGRDTRHGGKYVDVDALSKTRDNTEETSAVEDLVFGKGFQGRDSKSSCQSKRSPEADYIIDPITNRKVKKTLFETPDSNPHSDGDAPTNTFKSYRHKGVFWHPSHGIDSVTDVAPLNALATEANADPYDDLYKYKPLMDEKPLTVESDTNHKPEDLDAYGPVKYQEPDGKAADRDLVEEYKDLSLYGAIRYQEPDGKPAHQESAREYEDLGDYGAVRYQEPDGKITPSEPFQQYEDLDKYDAVRSHEPDGKYQGHVESAVDREELSKYQAFLSHEPDGKYAASYVEPALDPTELAQYKPFRSHEPDGKYAPSHAQPADEKFELSQYQAFRSHEPDGRYAGGQVEPQVDSAELSTYKAFRSHEPDGKYCEEHAESTAEFKELKQYQAVRSYETNGKYAIPEESSTEAPDLGNHEAFGPEDSETKPTPTVHYETGGAAELQEYSAVRYNEPDGKPPVESEKDAYGPAELDKYQAVRWNEPDGKPVDEQIINQDNFEFDVKSERLSEAEQEGKTNYRKLQDSLMAQHAVEPPLKGSKTLTGNYARDFPEEFAHSWRREKSDPSSPLLPSDINISSIPEPRETNSPKAASTTPLNDATAPEPTIYKILVYNATMQSIEVAETTSIVPDNAAPLTPAEVLLRISNPSKFFAHFGPLQAQGFEIVSGSGDILIFRKVREAAIGEDQVTHPVNPIDMTGSNPRDYNVAAGRFASPTGFVNYNFPSDPPTERFVSGIDVRREEPVFSGPKTDGSKRDNKKSLPKRVALGAAWVAGVSYSLGVVGEYFRTGGEDGKGPKGLL